MLSVTRSCRQNYYAIKINEKTGRFFMEQETACKASVYHTESAYKKCLREE